VKAVQAASTGGRQLPASRTITLLGWPPCRLLRGPPFIGSQHHAAPLLFPPPPTKPGEFLVVVDIGFRGFPYTSAAINLPTVRGIAQEIINNEPPRYRSQGRRSIDLRSSLLQTWLCLPCLAR
jgi:hypothetical protein